MSYPSRGRKVRRRRKNLNIRNLVILIAGFVVTILLLVLLIHGAVRLVSKGIGAITGNGESTSGQSSTVSGESGGESEPVSEPPVTWTTVEMTEADEREGDLILVNAAHEYTAEPDDMIIMYGNKPSSYGLSLAEMYMKTDALTALNSMMDAFQAATGIGNTLVTSTYRTVEYQQELYDEDIAATGGSTSDSVQQPGHSEHHTGYAADLMYSSTSGWAYLDGTGDYAWFNENCYKYGYIVRYTADKQSITGIISEPWHLRYVGTVHAEAITKGGYCLEEYIDMVKLHDYENPYSFVSENGETYLIYYVEGQGATTEIPVQVGRSYEISGTNEGGFIVTIPTSSTGSTSTSTSTETSGESGASGESTSGNESSLSGVSGVSGVSEGSEGSSSESSN